MKILSLSLLVLISACNSRGPVFQMQEDPRITNIKQAKRALAAFKASVSTTTTREEVENAFGEATRHAIKDGETVYYYDIPNDPVVVTYTPQGLVKSYVPNEALVARREAQEQAEANEEADRRARIGNAISSSMAQFNRPQTNCTTTRGIGGTLQTSCQ